MVNLFATEQAKQVIVKFYLIIFDERLIDYTPFVFQSHVHIIKEVMNRLIIVSNIKVGTNDNFFNRGLSEPLLEVRIRRATRVIASGKVKWYARVYGRLPIALDG